MKIKKVIVVVNPGKAHAQQTAATLRDALTRAKVKQKWLKTIASQPHFYRKLHNITADRADLIIACGGDGTLLQTAHRFRGSGIPILGINIGYLGFITSVPGNRVRSELRRILNGDFVVSERSALDLTMRNGNKKVIGWALNDVVINRGDNPRLISLSAKVGRRPLTHYRCDGLIVATPTGSTAYSLAAGGPIISPECNVVTITPICPQALTNRSVVVNSTEVIEMRLEATSGPGDLQVDGMSLAKASPGSTITVQTSRQNVPIAFLPEINYYDVLGEKLKWSGAVMGLAG